jgi:MFS family permease
VTRGARYRLLAVVYASQFVPLAFLLYGLSAVLRERQVPLEKFAFIQLLGLVWVVKFAWAPLVDRYGSRRLGHYRGWLLVVQTLLTVAVLALIPVDVVTDLPLLVGIGAAIATPSGSRTSSGRTPRSSACSPTRSWKRPRSRRSPRGTF